MKRSTLRDDYKLDSGKETDKVPTPTLNDPLNRVEEWIRKPHTYTPFSHYKTKSNPPVDPMHSFDLAAQSRLVIEGVKLLYTRDGQIASNPPSVTAMSDFEGLDEQYQKLQYRKFPRDEERGVGIGKYFRDSQLSAKNYVKQFERTINQKKAFDLATRNVDSLNSQEDNKNKPSKTSADDNSLVLFNSRIHRVIPNVAPITPLNESKNKENPMRVPFDLMPTVVGISTARNGKHPFTKSMAQSRFPLGPSLMNANSSRSVRFTMRYANGKVLEPVSSNESRQGEVTDTMAPLKQENDRNWWRWKIKQRFMENDELFQKLVAQRRNFEVIQLLLFVERQNNQLISLNLIRSSLLFQSAFLRKKAAKGTRNKKFTNK